MERLTSDRPIPPALRGGVIALGNFDGFHAGHQAVVGRAVDLARAGGRPAIVATFDPHPVRYFRPDAPPFLLTTIEQRARLFEAAGADAMLLFRFDAALAAVSPRAFVVDLLIGNAGAARVVTGTDFTFGSKRAGTIETLVGDGEAYGLIAEAVSPVEDRQGPISSSRIRAALAGGDMAEAARLLTRPFAIGGEVRHGDKLGRTIGYPTANVEMGGYQRPKYGIYAVRARLADGSIHDGAANLGIRPSFDPPKELLETYLFDFSGDLYDQPIEVQLIRFLRPEAKFDTLDALVAQMDRDCAEAKAVLAGV